MDSDGKPYGPKRFKQIIQECWYISDNIHTSYEEVLDISISERAQLIYFISDKIKKQNEAIEASLNNK